MKNSIRLLVFFTILFSLPIVLGSCSSESTLTSPSENKNNTAPMPKVLANSTATIDHTIDTVITLPKSKISVVVNKNLSIDKIRIMDDYYSTHTISQSSKNKISPTLQSISPNYRWCPYHTDTISVLQNQYGQVPGKSLGIDDGSYIISLKDAHDIYGFSLAYANGFNDISNLEAAGYSDSNIMVGVGDPSKAHPNQYNKCGYYEIDEPLKMGYSYTATINFDDTIASWNSGAKLLLTDYNWPAAEVCDGGRSAGLFLTLYMSNNNTYIMCDQYDGDLCGSECDYWDEYSHYYNPIPFSNWLMNELIQSSNWSCAFNLANGSDQNINQIWLFADGDGDLTSLQTFCGYAWQYGWLVRQEGRLVEVWQNTDGTCNWETGNWTLISSHYISYYYTSY